MKKKSPFLVPSERSLSHVATNLSNSSDSHAKGPARKTVTGNVEQVAALSKTKKRKNSSGSSSSNTQLHNANQKEDEDVPIAKKTRSAMKKKTTETPLRTENEIDLSHSSDEEFSFQTDKKTSFTKKQKSIYTKKPKIEEAEETNSNTHSSPPIPSLSLIASTTPPIVHTSSNSSTSPINQFQPSASAHFYTMPPPPTILFLRVQLIDILDSNEEILEQTIIKVDMNIESTKQLNYLIEESSSRFESHSVSHFNTLYYFLNDVNSELRNSFTSVQKIIITTQHAYEDFLDYIRCKLRLEEYNLYFKN